MPNVDYKTTRRFINIWVYLALGSVGIILLAGFGSIFFVKPLASKTLQAREDEPAQLQPIKITPQAIGALRVDVTASIPNNRWLAYEVKIQDQQNKTLAAGLKNAWKESGVWYEEGQSGTWQEDDLEAGLDISTAKAEPITVVVDVLEYATSSNQPLTDPVSFNIKVNQGIVDTRYLWPGFWGGLLMAGLTCLFSKSAGVTLSDTSIGDSDLGDRVNAGGANKLIKVIVKTIADETSPPSLNCRLTIRDGNGDSLFKVSEVMPLRFKRDEDGDIDSTHGQATFFLVLEKPSSYGFYVEVTPDAPIDSTQMIIRQGAVTLGAIKVAHIGAA